MHFADIARKMLLRRDGVQGDRTHPLRDILGHRIRERHDAKLLEEPLSAPRRFRAGGRPANGKELRRRWTREVPGLPNVSSNCKMLQDQL